jgi:hypothetical protein
MYPHGFNQGKYGPGILWPIFIGIDGISDPAHRSGIGDPEGDEQEVRRFSTRQGCLVEKSRPRLRRQI